MPGMSVAVRDAAYAILAVLIVAGLIKVGRWWWEDNRHRYQRGRRDRRRDDEKKP